MFCLFVVRVNLALVLVMRRKTIYEYDRINFAKEDIKNWTVIYLKPLSTCVKYKKCEECVTQENSAFQVWQKTFIKFKSQM